ncbi:MAG: hypothetical protein AB1757_12175 [Acidobacteriota bacterium]
MNSRIGKEVRHLKIYTLVPILIFMVLAFAGFQKSNIPPKNVTGTYEVTYKRGAGGLLKVLQKSADEIEFEIEFNRGAPSYNSGVAGGTILVKNGVAVFKTTEYSEEGCEITFTFQANKVIVRQSGADFACGFGHGVICDGTYILKNRRKPKFGD